MNNQSNALGLTLLSGSGGSGRTAAGMGIAAAQARNGLKTLFMDFCFGWSGLNINKGEAPEFQDIFSRESGFSELTTHCSGGYDIFTCVPPEVFEFGKLELEHLSKCVYELALHYELLIIDPPSGAHPLALLAAGMCEEIILMIKPEASAVASSYCLLKTLSGEGIGEKVSTAFSFVDSPEHAQSLKSRFDALTGKFLKLTLSDGGFTYRWTENEREEFFVGRNTRQSTDFVKNIKLHRLNALHPETGWKPMSKEYPVAVIRDDNLLDNLK